MSSGVPKVIIGDSEDKHSKLPKLRLPKGKFLAVAVVIILILAGIGYGIYKKAHNPDITIGKTVITPAEIQELTNEISRYSTATSANFGGSAQQVAQNELILNAALKDQASQHNIQISQANIDDSLTRQYQKYGSKAAYQGYVKASGIADITRIVSENSNYEAKLTNVVIAKKNLFLVAITYDAPYFNAASNPAALRAQATKTLQTKFLPLFKEGKSDAQIAAQADINYLAPGSKSDPSPFFTGMPTMAFGINGCTTAKPCFNDAQVGSFASLPGIVSTQTKIDQLNKAGQYTNVFTSEAGFIGIMRLSSKTAGTYNSWDQLLKDYDQKYAPHITFLSIKQPNSANT